MFYKLDNDYQVSDPSWHVETAPLEVSGVDGDEKYSSQDQQSDHRGGRERLTTGVGESTYWRALYCSQPDFLVLLVRVETENWRASLCLVFGDPVLIC